MEYACVPSTLQTRGELVCWRACCAETAVLPLRPPGAPSLPPVSNIMRRRSRAGRSVGTGRDGVEANGEWRTTTMAIAGPGHWFWCCLAPRHVEGSRRRRGQVQPGWRRRGGNSSSVWPRGSGWRKWKACIRWRAHPTGEEVVTCGGVRDRGPGEWGRVRRGDVCPIRLFLFRAEGGHFILHWFWLNHTYNY